jgi:hypothetical protein
MQAASDRIENNELCTTFYAESLYGFKCNLLYMHVHLIHSYSSHSSLIAVP